MFPVSRKPQRKKRQSCCPAGIAGNGSALYSPFPALPDFPCPHAALYFRESRSRRYGKLPGLFFVYPAFLPVYRSVRCRSFHYESAERQPQAHDYIRHFQLSKYRRKCYTYLWAEYGCCRCCHFHSIFPDFLCRGRYLAASRRNGTHFRPQLSVHPAGFFLN